MARGGVVTLTIFSLYTIIFLLSFKTAEAASFTVGDDKGWAPGVCQWPVGKKFAVGDVLVFKYNPAENDVATVCEAGYNMCTSGGEDVKCNTGNDEIVLKKGKNFFISTCPGQCQSGVKMVVDAC